MKILRLKIKNIGMIADEEIILDKPLILFYGEIRQGKTTILNAFRWLCGGEFPSDIIRHGETEATISADMDGGYIERSFYVAKDKTTKARQTKFVRDGKPVLNPAAELKRYLNPFLLNQDHLRNMSELERKRFFAELFAVDTTELDKELVNSERNASNLRAEIKGYGEIVLNKVEAMDVSALKAQRELLMQDHAKKVAQWQVELKQIESDYAANVQEVDKANNAVLLANATVSRQQERLESVTVEIGELTKKLEGLQSDLVALRQWLMNNPPATLLAPRPTAPDTSSLRFKIAQPPDTAAIDAQLSASAANQVRAEQYQRDLARNREKSAKETELRKLEQRQRAIKEEKVAKLKGVSTTCGIEGLEFSEDGTFVYQGTQAGMLSTSQVMKLSSELSALYPEGFGVELLDRGESLGKSIFEFVDRAKAEKKTILATIVGERPAEVPPEIGVFVVESGRVVQPKQEALL